MEHINIGKKYTNDDLGFVPQKKKNVIFPLSSRIFMRKFS